jgi:putative membrane protein
MKRTIAAALLFSTLGAGVVLAQTTPSSSTVPPVVTTGTNATTPTSTMSPAVTTKGVNTTTAAPVAGANSFTMAQAKKRIEDQGYTQVSTLAKDNDSVWRGHAMKDGKEVNVALDYQGNVTAN